MNPLSSVIKCQHQSTFRWLYIICMRKIKTILILLNQEKLPLVKVKPAVILVSIFCVSVDKIPRGESIQFALFRSTSVGLSLPSFESNVPLHQTSGPCLPFSPTKLKEPMKWVVLSYTRQPLVFRMPLHMQILTFSMRTFHSCLRFVRLTISTVRLDLFMSIPLIAFTRIFQLDSWNCNWYEKHSLKWMSSRESSCFLRVDSLYSHVLSETNECALSHHLTSLTPEMSDRKG